MIVLAEAQQRPGGAEENRGEASQEEKGPAFRAAETRKRCPSFLKKMETVIQKKNNIHSSPSASTVVAK